MKKGHKPFLLHLLQFFVIFLVQFDDIWPMEMNEHFY